MNDMNNNLLNTLFNEKMSMILIIPFIIQAVAISIDEFYFHHRRGLGRWEQLGHPLDTLTVISLYVFCVIAPFNYSNLLIYICLASFSCLFVTKDEFIHNKLCSGAEQWLHSILFLIHGLTSVSLGVLWSLGFSYNLGLLNVSEFLISQIFILSIFCIYQILYWNLFYTKRTSS